MKGKAQRSQREREWESACFARLGYLKANGRASVSLWEKTWMGRENGGNGPYYGPTKAHAHLGPLVQTLPASCGHFTIKFLLLTMLQGYVCFNENWLWFMLQWISPYESHCLVVQFILIRESLLRLYNVIDNFFFWKFKYNSLFKMIYKIITTGPTPSDDIQNYYIRTNSIRPWASLCYWGFCALHWVMIVAFI